MTIPLSQETKDELSFIANLLPNGLVCWSDDANAVMVSWDNYEHHLEAETTNVTTDWFYWNRKTLETVLFTCNFGESPNEEIKEKFKYFKEVK